MLHSLRDCSILFSSVPMREVESPTKLADKEKGSRNMVLIMGVGQVTHEDECMLQRYSKQLSHLGMELSLFRDMSAEKAEASPLPLSFQPPHPTPFERN